MGKFGDRPQRGRGGGPRPSFKPSDRSILYTTGRATTPEQLEGMNVDGPARFIDVSSSSEESESEDEAGARNSSSEEEGEIRRKRFKVDAAPVVANEAPKWSNPDPYTALPAPGAGLAPRKDIVQVIRKAKNDAAPRHDMTHAAKANDDFISFTFDEDNNIPSQHNIEQSHTFDGHPPNAPLEHQMPLNGFQAVNGTRVPDAPSAPSINLRSAARVSNAAPRAAPPSRLTDGAEDELLGQQDRGVKGKKRKFEELAIGKGDVIEQWAADPTADSTPWYVSDNAGSADAEYRYVHPLSQAMVARMC